jgi:hypothetical protein
MGRSNLGRSLGQILSAMPGGGARLQLHRTLAERIMHTYRSDATALDAAFFPQGLMGAALDRAADDVADTPQSLAAADHFTPADLRQIGLWGDVFARLGDADPDFLSWAVRHPDQRPARMPARSEPVQAQVPAGTPVSAITAPDGVSDDVMALALGVASGGQVSGPGSQDTQSTAARRLADAAGALVQRIAAVDPARFAQAIRSPDERQRPAAAKTRDPGGRLSDRAQATANTRILPTTATLSYRLPRPLVGPLGRVTRAIRTTLRRLGW